MNNRKPDIGVTGPDKGGTAAWWFTKLALMVQGARAIRIQPKSGYASVEIDGLIIGGGADINPKRYGESGMEELLTSPEELSGPRRWLSQIGTALFFPFIFLIRKIFSTRLSQVDEERDRLEFELLKKAVEEGLPILGICRGAQLINIHFGGSLHSSIDSFYTEVPKVYSVWPKKNVEIKESSKLFSILNTPDTCVNALHNQAVDRLGEGLAIVAREKNGIVQAIEHSSHPFLIGVQWHPEYMPQIPTQRRLFRGLAEQAREIKSEKGGDFCST